MIKPPYDVWNRERFWTIKIGQVHLRGLIIRVTNPSVQNAVSIRMVNLLLASNRSRNPNNKINALVSSDGVQNIGARFALKRRSEAYLTKVKHTLCGKEVNQG